MTTRTDIMNALNTAGIEGVTAFKGRPTVLEPGAAWPQVQAHELLAGLWEVTWGIYVIMPADITAAEDWYDDNIQDLRDALQPVVFIDRDEPTALNTGNNTVFAVLITARSE